LRPQVLAGKVEQRQPTTKALPAVWALHARNFYCCPPLFRWPTLSLRSRHHTLVRLTLALVRPSAGAKWPVDKRALDECVTRRMFVVPSFEIHGGVAGLYDYGPPGCAVKENVLALWRQHFVLEDNILQIECTTLTPHPVLKASGHVDKFEDLMVRGSEALGMNCYARGSCSACAGRHG
jgi:hypothetical protein